MEALLDLIQIYHPVSAEAAAALGEALQREWLPKHAQLVNAGRTCRHLYFLEKGAIRGYYHLEEKEITHWFGFENDFVTSFHSFITGEPAVENIQALEGCLVWSISKENLHELFNRFHEIERVVRIAYERYYIRLEERFINAQFKTAAERYEQLLAEQPHILERVPLGQVAAYLGISQETLSRIRGRL